MSLRVLIIVLRDWGSVFERWSGDMYIVMNWGCVFYRMLYNLVTRCVIIMEFSMVTSDIVWFGRRCSVLIADVLR